MAGYTSGGEQQMCAIGRALMSRPKMILLDEPSMGLAPQIVEEIFTIMKSLNDSEGVSFLLAEQNTNLALKYSGYGYILENGRVVLDGAAAALCARTRTSRNSISASPKASANRSAKASTTNAASAGWRERSMSGEALDAMPLLPHRERAARTLAIKKNG